MTHPTDRLFDVATLRAATRSPAERDALRSILARIPAAEQSVAEKARSDADEVLAVRR